MIFTCYCAVIMMGQGLLLGLFLLDCFLKVAYFDYFAFRDVFVLCRWPLPSTALVCSPVRTTWQFSGDLRVPNRLEGLFCAIKVFI